MSWEEKLWETKAYYERELQALKDAAKEEIRELWYEVAEWEELAQAVADAYATCNGQLTEALKQAIENLIAFIPKEVSEDVV